MKNKSKWTNITNVLADLIDEIQRHTMEKEDLGPFPLQWKALEALNWLLSFTMKRWKMWVKELQAYSLKWGVNSLWNAAYNVYCQRRSL